MSRNNPSGGINSEGHPLQTSRCQVCGLQVLHHDQEARLTFEDTHHAKVHKGLAPVCRVCRSELVWADSKERGECQSCWTPPAIGGGEGR